MLHCYTLHILKKNTQIQYIDKPLETAAIFFSSEPLSITGYYYVRRKDEPHENRRFFSTGTKIAKNAYTYVLKAPSRS